MMLDMAGAQLMVKECNERVDAIFGYTRFFRWKWVKIGLSIRFQHWQAVDNLENHLDRNFKHMRIALSGVGFNRDLFTDRDATNHSFF